MTPDELDALLVPDEWDRDRCQVAQALERITDEERHAKVAAAVADRRVPVGNVLKAIKGLIGVTPRPNTLRRHRLGGCACE